MKFDLQFGPFTPIGSCLKISKMTSVFSKLAPVFQISAFFCYEKHMNTWLVIEYNSVLSLN